MVCISKQQQQARSWRDKRRWSQTLGLGGVQDCTGRGRHAVRAPGLVVGRDGRAEGWDGGSACVLRRRGCYRASLRLLDGLYGWPALAAQAAPRTQVKGICKGGGKQPVSTAVLVWVPHIQPTWRPPRPR